ncbi:MAG: ABC transporter permease [Bacteroidota bacterium]|nr:ABC transporter permease [Bacteroidota bacterium]
MIIKLAWIGVGLSVAVMIIAVAIVIGYKNEITEKVIGFGGHIEIHSTGTSGNFDYIQFSDSSHLVKQILDVENISTVSPVISRPGIIKAENDLEGIVFKGVNGQYDFSFLKKNILKGRIPLDIDSFGKREILVSKIIASKLKIDTGDIVKVYFINDPVRVIPCSVVGVYETGIEETDMLFVVGSLVEMQRIFANKQNEITHYEVKTKDFKNVMSTTQLVNQHIPIELNSENLVQLNPQIFDWLGYLDQNISIILILMIVVACINMITALLILIIERTTMIGVLKALGARNSTIRNIFLKHAFFILLIGLILGNSLGIGLAWFQDYYRFITLPQETYYLSYVPVEINAAYVWYINLGTIAICMVALWLPVRIINKIDPVKAIKFN